MRADGGHHKGRVADVSNLAAGLRHEIYCATTTVVTLPDILRRRFT
jgi:hypothetical protein